MTQHCETKGNPRTSGNKHGTKLPIYFHQLVCTYVFKQTNVFADDAWMLAMFADGTWTVT